MNEKIVLCVDDDELFLGMLSSYLKAFGYAVVSETIGTEGVRRATERQFDAAVLDCFLPDLEAGELAIEVNRQQPQTPIVICTGAADAVPAEARAVANAVISKDSGVEALFTSLERATIQQRRTDTRRFIRYPVEFPFILTPTNSSSAKNLHGRSTTIAEGGLGGILDGEVPVGENVLIRFLEPRLKSLKAEAQVLYRVRNVYGFEFLRLGARQRARLRQSFQTCAVN